MTYNWQLIITIMAALSAMIVNRRTDAKYTHSGLVLNLECIVIIILATIVIINSILTSYFLKIQNLIFNLYLILLYK